MQSLHVWTRRVLRGLVPAGMYVVLASFTPATAAPDRGPAVTAPSTAAVAPLDRLKSGNERFVRGVSGQDAATPGSAAEHPFAMVLSCADARLAPEHIFAAGAGDLYTVRALGAVVDRSVLASLEYAVSAWHTPLLVVMGHESCAAVQAAHTEPTASSDNLEYLYRAIRGTQPRLPADQQALRAAILANVEEVINDALAGSEALRDAVGAGRLQVVGAYYEASSGVVVFSDPITAATAARE